MAPLLGYWNIRGLAHAIRLSMAYVDAELEEKRYKYGPPPEFNRSEWFNEKFTLGLDFPNIPYFIDGDIKITQSLAIMRYIARKYKLDGKSEKEKIRIDIAEQQLNDLREGFVNICYNPNYESLKTEFLKALPDKLKALSEFYGKGKWTAGENFSYVDILLYDVLDIFQLFDPGCLSDLPNLQEHIKKFEALPTISEYMKSDKFMKWPLNGDMAKFGSKFQKAP